MTAGGGIRHFTCLYVLLRQLRSLGCTLPVQVWYLGRDEMTPEMEAILTGSGAELVNARHRLGYRRLLNGWELKPSAILSSGFDEVIWLDCDCFPLRDPAEMFSWPEYRRTGAVLFPDYVHWEWRPVQWELFGLMKPEMPSSGFKTDPECLGRPIPLDYQAPVESGCMCLDLHRVATAIRIAAHLCDHSDYWFRHFHGDKDMIDAGFRLMRADRSTPPTFPDWDEGVKAMRQHDFDGEPFLHHRTGDKLFRRVGTFPEEERFRLFAQELDDRWSGECWNVALPADDLTPYSGRFRFETMSYDLRTIELLPDGSIGEGRTDREDSWGATRTGSIDVKAKDGSITWIAERDRIGGYCGRFTQGARDTIRLIRVEPETEGDRGLMLTLAGFYIYETQPRACSKAWRANGTWEVLLEPDGKVTGALQPLTWSAHQTGGSVVITIRGNHHPETALTQRGRDGIWRGLWSAAPHCPVELRRKMA